MSFTGDTLRPVHALLKALEGLENCEGPGDPRRGPLRQRAWNLARILPAGALLDDGALALQPRFRRLVDEEIPLHASNTLCPPPRVGATYWLSSHDALGAVFRVGLAAREDGEHPFATFWPALEADAIAERTAAETYRLAARTLKTPPLAPLFGWHRLEALDPGPPPLERIEGSSFGAALVLMLISAWSEHPLPQDLAVTGCLDREEKLRLEGNALRSVAAKTAALIRERPCVRRLLVPRGAAQDLQMDSSDLEIIEVDGLEDLLEAFSLRGATAKRPPTVGVWLDAVHEATWLDRTRSVPPTVLCDRLEALVAAYGPLIQSAGYSGAPPWALAQAHAEVLVLLCRHRAYLGESEGAMQVATELQWLLETAGGMQRPEHATTARLLNALASLLIELGRTNEAHRYAEAALGEAKAADDRLETARILSTVGRIAAHAGDDEGALPHLAAALAAFEEVAPWEANICRCYQIACLARLGEFDAARAALVRAEADNAAARGMSDGWQRSNALYLSHERLRLALLSGAGLASAEAEASTRLEQAPAAPWPAAVILSRLLEAALARDAYSSVDKRLEALHALARRTPAAIVARHRDRGASAIVASRLATSRPIEASLLESTTRWLKARADHGPPAKSAKAQALLDDLGPIDPAHSATLRALLSTDVY